MNPKSSKPKKQRKKLYSMSLHERNKTVSAKTSEKIRKETEKKSLPLRKGDKVKIMRGSSTKKTGKITKVDYTKRKIFIEGITRKKVDGTEILIGFHPSNLMIIELFPEDERRIKGKKIKKEKTEKKTEEKKTEKKEK